MSFLSVPGGSVKECLGFEERPSTPPEIRKYRRSTNLEPGHRFQHPGLADDYPKMNLDYRIYGIKDNPDRVTASDLINQPKTTELQRINNIKAEKIYKQLNKEPLGHSPDRKIKLPAKFTEELVPFGCKSVSSLEPAKDLIFPTLTADSIAGADLYKRSHGSYGPGEQRSRDYKWHIDPKETRFGRKGDTIAMNGVSTNVNEVLKASLNVNLDPANTKKVEDFRNMGDILGQSKNLGQDSGLRPRDIVYGKASGVKGLTASEVMKGRYKPDENKPDNDLGKSLTPGFRNINLQDRAFGCPSIRSDIPTVAVSRRSLADSQNYGDDVPAQDLINPPAFSDLSIGPMAMEELRSKAKILDLFARIGYKFDSATSDMLFERASRDGRYCSMNAFRDVVNDFIITNDLVSVK